MSMASGRHLFILSGQSNMQRLKVGRSFTPLVTCALGGDDAVLVVKEAWGGQSIRRWCHNWQSAPGIAVPAQESHRRSGDLYDRLLQSVLTAISHASPPAAVVSVTLVWMQGEEDAQPHLAPVYGKNLRLMLQRLKRDLLLAGQSDAVSKGLKLILGELNDYGLGLAIEPHWRQIQAQQQALVLELSGRLAEHLREDLADSSVKDQHGPAATLVVCRDLPLHEDGLHFTAEGYHLLGQRFAEAAVKMLKA
tara:strand:+ start:4363 stop:5112 length:750 start_codon:yes stop_codon:yes gene_type:complete